MSSILRREWTLAALASILLALLMTWPAALHPATTIPNDLGDPLLQSWELAWAGHIATTSPADLWDGNAFYPDNYSFAFSDTLLGYLPAALIGSGPTAAVVRYNILFILAFALAFGGAYALARQLGSRVPGAALAGAAFAYAPWRWGQVAHLHVLSTGGIVLSLALLAWGHGYSLRHGYRPELRRPGAALAGWLVAAWQMTLGFGVGLPFAYVLGFGVLIVGVIWLVRRRRGTAPVLGRRLILHDGLGITVFVLVSAFMAYPYLKVVSEHPYAKRTLQEIAFYSPPLRGFLVSPYQSLVWGDAFEPARKGMEPLGANLEMVLLPGFTVLLMAVAGLFLSVFGRRTRLLLLAGVALSVALAMGMRFADGALYKAFFYALPGWNSIRTPGRLVVWATLLLGLLAAGALTAAQERWPVRRRLVGAAACLPLVLALVEGAQTLAFPVVPAAPSAVTSAIGPVLVLPSDQVNDEGTMFWSTTAFPRLVNGGSGFIPHRLAETRAAVASFPDAASVAYLRGLGVVEVVVLRHPTYGDPPVAQLAATGAGLGITREETPDAVVFRLS